FPAPVWLCCPPCRLQAGCSCCSESQRWLACADAATVVCRPLLSSLPLAQLFCVCGAAGEGCGMGLCDPVCGAAEEDCGMGLCDPVCGAAREGCGMGLCDPVCGAAGEDCGMGLCDPVCGAAGESCGMGLCDPVCRVAVEDSGIVLCDSDSDMGFCDPVCWAAVEDPETGLCDPVCCAVVEDSDMGLCDPVCWETFPSACWLETEASLWKPLALHSSLGAEFTFLPPDFSCLLQMKAPVSAVFSCFVLGPWLISRACGWASA
uniref:Uncharacterized protein n=1 Tax=Oryzias latipes TaxID=8090 RepID=A0A3P9KJ78_ORYLA